jgi:DNA primase large subunit
MLVKATKIDYLIPRYSHAEAVRVEKLLESDLESEQNKALIEQIFREVLKIDIVPVMKDDFFSMFDYKIHIMEYLKHSTGFHEIEWKLVNRVVDHGYVYLKTHDLIRLIRQEIDNIIRCKLRDMVVPRLPSNLEKAVQEIVILLPAPSKMKYKVKVTPDKYPPCVKKVLDTVVKGENLPHYGRFLLTTYLVNIGQSVEEIISLYSRSPDFNEKTTKYQVEHIAGLSGGRQKYMCPSCKTLLTHNFCLKNKACNDIKNPLSFGFRKSQYKKRKSK